MKFDFLKLDVRKLLSRLVKEHPSRAVIFERFGFDCRNNKKQTLIEACVEGGVDSREIARALYEHDHELTKQRHREQRADCSKKTLTELTLHFEQTHHAYMKTELPSVMRLSKMITQIHSDNEFRSADIYQLATAFQKRLLIQMADEEEIFFPLVRTLKSKPVTGTVDYLTRSIVQMNFEYIASAADLKKLRELAQAFQSPQHSGHVCRELLAALREMDDDFQLNVQKKIDILFPRCLEAQQNN